MHWLKREEEEEIDDDREEEMGEYKVDNEIKEIEIEIKEKMNKKYFLKHIK